MPKYAANLSAAPLQPQKQAQPATSNMDIPEKSDSSESGKWVDPFTTDGQECKYMSFCLLFLIVSLHNKQQLIFSTFTNY